MNFDYNTLKIVILILIILYLVNHVKIEGFTSAQSQELNRSKTEILFESQPKPVPTSNPTNPLSNDDLLRPEITPEIIIRNTDEIIPLKLGTSPKTAYPYELGIFFRHNIYPTIPVITQGTLSNIKLLLKNKINYAFVDEDILIDIISNNGSSGQSINPLTSSSPIKAIAPLYYQYAVLVTHKDSNITDWINVNSKTVGVLSKNSNTHTYLRKFIVATRIIYPDLKFKINIKIYNESDEMINDFLMKKIDATFFMTNQKNSILREITDSIEIKIIAPLSQYRKQIRTVEDLELHNDYIKKKNAVVTSGNVFNATLFKKNLNLNYFYRSTNTYSFIETYASRIILVTNDTDNKRVNDVTLNLIKQLNNLKDHMNNYENSKRGKFVNDMIDNSFEFDEFASINKKIPIHDTTKKILINHNLIHIHEGASTATNFP